MQNIPDADLARRYLDAGIRQQVAEASDVAALSGELDVAFQARREQAAMVAEARRRGLMWEMLERAERLRRARASVTYAATELRRHVAWGARVIWRARLEEAQQHLAELEAEDAA